MIYARETALIATPVGTVAIEGDADVIHRIAILDQPEAAVTSGLPPLVTAATQIGEYFAGTRRQFDLPLAPAGTPRGGQLRRALVDVSYGTTMSYGELATHARSGARAIGQLCARNPFPIVVPCHRVLASGGLGAYSAGGGVNTKAWLLDHERRHSTGDER